MSTSDPTGTAEASEPAHLAPGVAVDHVDRAPSHLRESSAASPLVGGVGVDERGGDQGEPKPADTPSEHAGQASKGGPKAHKWWTLVAVCLGTFMLLLDITIVNVALPDIQTSLHASFSDLQWVVDAYALTLAALLLTAGSLADMFGRRRLYIIGLTIFTGASLLCGVAGSALLLQLARGLQGVGGAVMFSVSLALLADAFRGKDRGTAFGIWGAITGLAVAIGPLLGGALTSGLSWRWIFLVNLPVGVAAVYITFARVAESRSPHARRPDWAGFVLFSLALASLVYGLIESNQKSFGSGLVIGCLIAAAALLAAFLVVERRGSSPMFDLSLFRLPTFTGGSVAAFGLSASIFALILYLVLYLQDVLDYSALATGLRLLVLSGGILVMSTIAGRVSSHVPVRFLDRTRPVADRRRIAADARARCRIVLDASDPRPASWPAPASASSTHRWRPPPWAWSRRNVRAWLRASTRRSARWASPPASLCWVPCSRTRSAARSSVASVASLPCPVMARPSSPRSNRVRSSRRWARYPSRPGPRSN